MGKAFRCKWGEHSSAEDCGRKFSIQAAPDPQNQRFVIKNYTKSHPRTDPFEFSLFPSQHLWRTWGPQAGAKFRTLRSFLFLAKSWGEPCSCTCAYF